jgi:AcrR family transcriptional regulator
VAKSRSTEKREGDGGDTKRQERAERILDATAELMLRWGYRKTTIDDIAKQAGVAKGTIYLHWKSREDLFEAVIIREGLRVAKMYAQNIANDPQGATLTSLTRHSVIAVLENPLLSAILRQDTEILGALRDSASGNAISQTRIAAGKAYFELLRSHDMIRIDKELEMQIKTYSATVTGFLTFNQFAPENFQFSQAEMLEALEETIHRTFDPDSLPDSSVVGEVTRTFLHMLAQVITSIEMRYQEVLL